MFCLLQNSEFAGVLQFPRVQFPIEKKAPTNTPIAWSPIPSTRPIYLIRGFPSRIAPPPTDPASLAVYPALQQDMLSCCIPKDLQRWNRTEKRRNPEEALQIRGERLRFVPGSSQGLCLCPRHAVEEQDRGCLAGCCTAACWWRKEISCLCELFIKGRNQLLRPPESLGAAEERGINELCHFAVTWKGIATHHKQHLGDLTVQIRKEWETSKPW